MDLNIVLTFGIPALVGANMLWRRLQGKPIHIPGMVRQIAPDSGAPVAHNGAAGQDGAPIGMRQWLDYVNAAPNVVPHLFVVGPTRAGKTTLARAIINERRGQVVVMTAKTKADWPGVEVTATRGGTASADAVAMFGALNVELNRRMEMVDQSRFTAGELTIVLDDYAALRTDCGESADTTVMRIARLGASLLMRLIVITDTTLVEAIGFKGLGEARNHFVSLYPTRQRSCTIGLQSETERDGNGRLKEILTPIDMGPVMNLASRTMSPDRCWRAARDRNVELRERLGLSVCDSGGFSGAQTADRQTDSRQTDPSVALQRDILAKALIRQNVGRDKLRAALQEVGMGFDNAEYTRWSDELNKGDANGEH